jgi:hypothetical protein
MSLGTAVLIIGLLWLVIAYRAFRRFMLGLIVLAVVAIAIGNMVRIYQGDPEYRECEKDNEAHKADPVKHPFTWDCGEPQR